jgi:PAS domain S-box-containing protein
MKSNKRKRRKVKTIKDSTNPLQTTSGIAGSRASGDVANRERTGINLRLSEEKYKLTIDHIADAIHVADKDLNILLINKKLLEWAKDLGIGNKVIGRNIFEAYPFLPDRIREEYEAVFRTGETVRTEEVNIVKGKEVATETQKIPIFEDGRITKVITIIRDITESRMMEETLRDSEETFRSLAEYSPNMIFINKKGTVAYANERCEKIMGYTREEFYSPRFDFRTLIAPESLETVESSFTRHMRGEDIEPYEYALITKDGNRIDAIVTTRLINFENEPAILGVITDITERKKAERTLKERERELELKTYNLEETNTALKVLLKRRDEDRRELEEKVLLNIREVVVPYLEKLRKSGLDAKQSAYLGILESNLNDIVSSFTFRLSAAYLNLTPSEIKIANLVKQGKTNKEIAELLNISTRTAAFHRERIRKKLGIQNKKTNLKSYLSSLS